MARIAGVDGCPGGWLCVSLDTTSNRFEVNIFRMATELLAHDPFIEIMAVDMPIGLPASGRRRCDEEARTLLQNRHPCVQNAPIRPALYAPSRLAASAITQSRADREVGAHEWSLYPKIINLDLAITPLHQRWCFEIHPEVSFYAWNNNTPLPDAKNTDAGRQSREDLIAQMWPNARPTVVNSLEQRNDVNGHDYEGDDINDAFAALWTAQRILNQQAQRIPATPLIDDRGLRMEMWY